MEVEVHKRLNNLPIVTSWPVTITQAISLLHPGESLRLCELLAFIFRGIPSEKKNTFPPSSSKMVGSSHSWFGQRKS